MPLEGNDQLPPLPLDAPLGGASPVSRVRPLRLGPFPPTWLPEDGHPPPFLYPVRLTALTRSKGARNNHVTQGGKGGGGGGARNPLSTREGARGGEESPPPPNLRHPLVPREREGKRDHPRGPRGRERGGGLHATETTVLLDSRTRRISATILPLDQLSPALSSSVHRFWGHHKHLPVLDCGVFVCVCVCGVHTPGAPDSLFNQMALSSSSSSVAFGRSWSSAMGKSSRPGSGGSSKGKMRPSRSTSPLTPTRFVLFILSTVLVALLQGAHAYRVNIRDTDAIREVCTGMFGGKEAYIERECPRPIAPLRKNSRVGGVVCFDGGERAKGGHDRPRENPVIPASGSQAGGAWKGGERQKGHRTGKRLTL